MKHTNLGFLLVFSLALGLIGCGGSGAATGTDYTLDVEGTYSITPTVNAGNSLKLATPESQVLIGATIVEVTDNDIDSLGIRFTDLDVEGENPTDAELRITLQPSVISTGIIYKLCQILHIPLGQSRITIYPVISSLSDEVEFVASDNTTLLDNGTLALGELQGTAEDDDRSRIPILSDIPVINFLFQGEQHQASIDSLIIVLTPQILEDTE